MGRTRSAYPPEFREQMVALVRAGRTPEELAREFEPAYPRVGRLESPVTGSIVWDPLIGVLGRRYPQMKAIGLNWR